MSLGGLRFVFGVALGASCFLACRAILDIDDVTLREIPAETGPSEAGSVVDGEAEAETSTPVVDAGTDASRFCDDAGALFCADFDGPDAAVTDGFTYALQEPPGSESRITFDRDTTTFSSPPASFTVSRYSVCST